MQRLSYRPSGTDRFFSRSEAANCLATIIQSLRDKGLAIAAPVLTRLKI